MSCNCIYEERLIRIEKDIAELNVKMDTKKDSIYTLNKELLHERDNQQELLEKVTKVTVLLEESQKQRQDNNDKIKALEDKIDKLKLQEEVTQQSSSLSSFRNTMLAMIPVISIIVGVVLHFLA